MNYILVNGYTATGSSAVIDLLQEYDNTYVPPHEFRLLCDPFGIIDLDREINNSVDCLNDDIAIRNFQWFTNKYFKTSRRFGTIGLNYEKDYTKNIRIATEHYIEKMTKMTYTGYWWFLSLNQTVFQQLLFKLLRKLRIYDFRKHCKMRLVTVNESEFLKITQEYLDEIFEPLVSKNDFIILDQAIPANYPGYGERYFSSAKVINVERDPRDVYMNIMTEEKRTGAIVGHVGLDISKTHNVQLFIEWYKKYRRKGMPGDCLNIYFEDLILNYEVTKEKILDYLGISEKSHSKPREFLRVEKSIKNIEQWKNYPHQEEIKEIEKALPEYLYKRAL